MSPRGVELKKPAEMRVMRRAGLVVAEALAAMGAAVRPGVSTGELDQIGREVLAANGATSSFLNYGAEWGYPPYPGVACISVDEEIVHGIPGERVLAEGDIVSIDFGAIIDGWHGDAARSFFVGDVTDQVRKLAADTEASMWAGIAAARVGGRIGDISAAIEASITASDPRYGIIREYTGHGIGSQMHMDPDVPNHGRRGRGPKVVEGMCLAIEPMLTLGSADTATLEDEWTVVTRDRSWAAHWENTIAITKAGVWVMTEHDGGEARLTELGVPFAPLAD